MKIVVFFPLIKPFSRVKEVQVRQLGARGPEIEVLPSVLHEKERHRGPERQDLDRHARTTDRVKPFGLLCPVLFIGNFWSTFNKRLSHINHRATVIVLHSEPQNSSSIMCDHCRTYKPLLDAQDDVPRIYDKPPRINPTPTIPRPEASNNGCCSWRQSCCNGGCCDRVGNCCSPQPEARMPEKPAYGNGYGQPSISSQPYLPTDLPMPDRMPCARQERKLPMCYGGDCHDSKAGSKTNCTLGGKNPETESIPRQSER
ncbi:hypothetical protein WH47_00727 [Habropoda laboriosa]|uniref:Uncharacterized protein n=1 Tax=Habropoda laboriosa TaxID=597456 RepID=A0A0L7QYI6_9HYME|nr:hypothetical protein WH47_00727 [Habropoda laboriosa]